MALGALATAGTLLSFSKSSHWFVRIWDFPRVQLAAASTLSAALYRVLFFRSRPGDWAFLLANLFCIAWHGRKIRPYTRFASVQVRRAPAEEKRERSFRLLISNVRMENRQHDQLLEVVGECDPDLVLLVETDAAWARALQPLREKFEHHVEQVQENYYGMMLFSRLPLIDPEIKFLVQDDIPSVHTAIELPSGDRIFLHGLHPRPPEPIRDQHSTPRDAELVIVGRAIREASDRPIVVAGDLNDVAWSPTSELFLRLSGLFDPRIGRGFYNSYNADEPVLRWPLDHVFHSGHFQIVDLQRLRNIGSDHFPMLIELKYVPEATPEQIKPGPAAGDQQEADEKIEKQAEAAITGDDRPTRE
jgi:endonuclease/exonuclease/phosphatase (EEP) superfamily protein YafD